MCCSRCVGKYRVAKFLTDRIGACECILLMASANDHDKLFTAVTGRKIFLAAVFFKQSRQTEQYLVTKRMTVCIIDLLKVVNIRNKQTKCMFFFFLFRHLCELLHALFQLFIKALMIVQPRRCIHTCRIT